jgi:mono/diheme cytochrome c family protein
LSLAACANGAKAPSEEAAAGAAAARGHAIAEQRCSQCHAIDRTGLSPVPSAPLWRDLVLVRDVDGLAESFAEGSFVHSNGPVQMPEFTLGPAEIDDLLAYMKSLRAG